MKKLKDIKVIVGLLVGVIILAVVLSVVFVMADKEDDVDHTGEAQAPYSSSYLSGKNYKDVEALFKAEGFTNIKLEEIDDLIFGWLHDEGDVEEVSIAGDTDYSTSTWYPIDTLVVIRYHVFPKDDEDDNTGGNNGQGTNNGGTNTSDEILTVENCPELANILSMKADHDQAYADFANKYKGRTIKFDGSVYAMALHGNYTTRYDILIGACNFDPNSFTGPSFKLEDVNYYDLGLDTLYVEDEIWVGINITIVAKVGKYDSYRYLFYLDPISVKGR